MKVTFTEKLKYKFDNLMARGAVALVGILFLATTLVIVAVGLILSFISTTDGSLLDHLWASLMHVIDAGTITGADTANTEFVILMLLVTLCGIFVTSILIGIITTGFEEKLRSLKKGDSRVIEKDHVVILGFDNNVFTLISELIIANENHKNSSIVILDPQDKETIEEEIASHFPDLKTTRVICRTGSITDVNILRKCSLETCRSIIVNEQKDFMTIKCIIAINNYFNIIEREKDLPHIVATINDKSNFETISIISKGNVEVVLIEDAVSRIIAQSSRQPGLSNVLVELFDFDGDELYFENFPVLVDKTFGFALNQFEEAVVFGFKRGEKIHLNPKADTLLKIDDELILLVEDDGVAKITPHKMSDNIESIISDESSEETLENVLIIGVNDMLSNIVLELDNYFVKGSKVFVANESFENSFDDVKDKLTNIEMVLESCDTQSRLNLEKLTQDNISHVILLSDYNDTDENSDSLTLFKLIHLRDIAQKTGRAYSITSEMRDVSNQRLAEVAKVNDLVVGSNIINLILAQISENRYLSTVFQELLTAEGSEIYIRKASLYTKLYTELDFYQVTQALSQQNCVAIGYKKQLKDGFKIFLNPKKSDKFIFTETDYIISLSAD